MLSKKFLPSRWEHAAAVLTSPPRTSYAPTFISPSKFVIPKGSRLAHVLTGIIEEWSSEERKAQHTLSERWSEIFTQLFSTHPEIPFVDIPSLRDVFYALMRENPSIADPKTPFGDLILEWFTLDFEKSLFKAFDPEAVSEMEFSRVRDAIRNPRGILDQAFHERSPDFEEVVRVVFHVIRDLTTGLAKDDLSDRACVIRQTFDAESTSKTLTFGLKEGIVYLAISGSDCKESKIIHDIQKEIAQESNKLLGDLNNPMRVVFLPYQLSPLLGKMLERLCEKLPPILFKLQSDPVSGYGKAFYESWRDVYEDNIQKIVLDVSQNVLMPGDVQVFLNKKYPLVVSLFSVSDISRRC